MTQYFRWERRAAASAWNGALYPTMPDRSLSPYRQSNIHEVPDNMTLRECMQHIALPDAEEAGANLVAAREEKHKRDDPDAPEPVTVDTGPKGGPLNGGASVVAYQNWRGEVAIREIKPICLWFGSTQWHPEDQWFLKAWDVEKQVERDFALHGFVNPKEMANAIA